jgi:hypothetical protein
VLPEPCRSVNHHHIDAGTVFFHQPTELPRTSGRLDPWPVVILRRSSPPVPSCALRIAVEDHNVKTVKLDSPGQVDGHRGFPTASLRILDSDHKRIGFRTIHEIGR